MIHWLYKPKLAQVAKYIDCYWFIEKPNDTSGNDFPKLNPDPSAHLIISPDHQTYQYAMNSDTFDGAGTHWLYPHHQTMQLDHSKPFIHLGVKFHIGALYSLPIPEYVHPILDSVKEVQFADLLTNSGVPLAQLISLAQNNSQQCCATLDTLLLPFLAEVKEDQHSKITRKALPLLKTNTVSELGELLHCSQRTLERSFSRVTGLNLKQCQAINKLEAMLEYLYQRNSVDIDWAEVALQFGFSDQPHLIRHLKKQIGLTPKAYSKERGLTIDVYGSVAPMS